MMHHEYLIVTLLFIHKNNGHLNLLMSTNVLRVRRRAQTQSRDIKYRSTVVMAEFSSFFLGWIRYTCIPNTQ